MSTRFRVACFGVLIACMWIPEIHPRDESGFDVLRSRLNLLFANDTEKNARFDLGAPNNFESAEDESANEEEKEKEEEEEEEEGKGRHVVRLGGHKILCRVTKRRVEFSVSGMTHKPDSLMFYACAETKSKRRPTLDELVDFHSDRDDTEFCWISRERGPPKCETQHQQVAVFSRDFDSSLWSYQNVHVPAGCGCHLGLKHFN